ncbi:RNAse P Rpr2/Rpp21/SNM1 subunit domain-containing protein [Rhodocollybia butyracea]|uniref:RNAse P Rpr2/Rpp21/SNM1 subunit domain-containing protein n=1 Tax=Rhodocollybia butyracea TaxID=206335 RepID=A0A9P5Q2W7_9AGAR|nr:RNAse P Rpr2/Rpp21/SNM1 subunit domain-containing protein [Rhodocollybia butyracea]
MAKKTKNDVPNPNSVSNRDVIQRLNFLYQASVYLNNVHSASASSTLPSSAPSTSTSHPTSDLSGSSNGKSKNKKPRKKKTMMLNDLSRSYIETMKTVGTKTTVQLDPSVKRTLCKGCNMVLIPGSTASVRTKRSSNHGHIMVYTCTACKHLYRIPAAPILAPGEVPSASQAQVMEIDEVQSAPQSVMQTIQGISQVQGVTSPSAEPIPDTSREERKGKPQNRKKRKPIPPRLPPLFSRDAGHVVFAGNEQLASSNGSWNDGIFIT